MREASDQGQRKSRMPLSRTRIGRIKFTMERSAPTTTDPAGPVDTTSLMSLDAALERMRRNGGRDDDGSVRGCRGVCSCGARLFACQSLSVWLAQTCALVLRGCDGAQALRANTIVMRVVRRR